jgi:hypothetical protein
VPDNETVNLTDQINQGTSIELSHSLSDGDTKLTIDHSINGNTTFEVSKDNKGDVNAAVSIKF